MAHRLNRLEAFHTTCSWAITVFFLGGGSYRLLLHPNQLAVLGGSLSFYLLARCGQRWMGVCFNSFYYSCSYVSNRISDLLLVKVWCRFAIFDSDVCIGILSAVRQEKRALRGRRLPPIFPFSAKTVQAGKRAPIPFTMKHRDYLGRVECQPQRHRPLRNH